MIGSLLLLTATEHQTETNRKVMLPVMLPPLRLPGEQRRCNNDPVPVRIDYGVNQKRKQLMTHGQLKADMDLLTRVDLESGIGILRQTSAHNSSASTKSNCSYYRSSSCSMDFEASCDEDGGEDGVDEEKNMLTGPMGRKPQTLGGGLKGGSEWDDLIPGPTHVVYLASLSCVFVVLIVVGIYFVRLVTSPHSRKVTKR